MKQGLLQRSKCGKEKSVHTKGFRQRHISNCSWTCVGCINRQNEKWGYALKKIRGYSFIVKGNCAHSVWWNQGKVWLHLPDSSTAGFTNTVGGEWRKYLPVTWKTMNFIVTDFVLFLRKSFCSFVQLLIVTLNRKEKWS